MQLNKKKKRFTDAYANIYSRLASPFFFSGGPFYAFVFTILPLHESI